MEVSMDIPEPPTTLKESYVYFMRVRLWHSSWNKLVGLVLPDIVEF
jgi:hypothetical protein